MIFFGGRKIRFKGNPIFIGGDGRSGTTLLSVVLDSHSRLAVGPELHFGGPKNLGPYARECASLLDENNPDAFGQGLKNNPDLKLGVQFAKRCHRYGIEFRDLISMIDESIRETSSELKSFEQRCVLINKIGESRRQATGKDRWGIKIMREIKHLDRYRALWPEARFIHIIRDGRDVAASQMIEHGSWGYGDIEKAAKGWVELIRDSRKKSNGREYLEVRYEDLVNATEKSLDSIMKFIGYDVEPAMLRHHEVDHTLFENPYNHASIEQVTKPMNSSSIGRFRKDLNQEQQSMFWKIAGKQLAEFGYEQ